MSCRDVLAILALAIGTGWAEPPPAAAAPPPKRAPTGRFVVDSVRVGDVSRRFSVWLPPGHQDAGSWPAILYLHGSGECGEDGTKPTMIGIGPALRAHPGRWPCVVVFPQKPREDEEWEEREDLVFAVLEQARLDFRVDTARVALCGISQGGHGVWILGARYPERWTCLAPICGYGRARTVSPRVARLPVWAFHGLMDDLVDPADTRNIVEGIRIERRRLQMPPDSVRMTLYPEANHNSWDAAFAEAELPAWMLRQSKPR